MAERDGDKPKKSWREIDAKRNRSGGSAGGSSSPPSGGDGRSRSESDRASKQYRAALEALFDKGGVGKVAEKLGAPPIPASTPRTTAPTPPPDGERLLLRKKVMDAIGRDEVTRTVDKYLKDHALPDDWEFLEQSLEHRDDDRVRETMARLTAMLERDKPKRSRVMAAKLRMIEETSDDPALRAEAARVRARLG